MSLGDRSYLAHRAVQLMGAGGLAFGASLLLPPAQAGFFFLLLSLLGAQALLDAGSSTVLLSRVARTMRHLRWEGGRPAGSIAAIVRLGDLARLALAWGGASAALALVVVLPLALMLLDLRPEAALIDPARHITVATMTALALYQLGAALPLIAEGSGRVAEVARMRAGLDLLAYLAAAACLLSGQGLWAPATLWGLRGAGNLLWSLWQAPGLLGPPRRRSGLRWRLARTMAPMQGRLALSWTASLLAQQSLVPISYALLGPAMTGRIGLALFLVNGVLMLATAAAASRVPELGRLGAARRWVDFDLLATQALRRALTLAGAGHALALAGVAVLAAWPGDAAARLPALSWLALLALSSLASTAIQTIAAALRACGDEPFLAPSLWGAVLLPPVLMAGAQLAGAPGLCLAHLLLNAGLGLPWALVLRQRFEAAR